MLHLCGALVSALGMTGQVAAEGNRLLPFWGQPYPYGYARAVEHSAPPQWVPCGNRPGPRDARVGRHRGSKRCNVVLHALD